jgi:hypothetical protein
MKFLLGLMTAALVQYGLSQLRPYDTTDYADRRSGLGLYEDAMTGCQYLSAGLSGITPRMARDGKTHLGCRSQ